MDFDIHKHHRHNLSDNGDNQSNSGHDPSHNGHLDTNDSPMHNRISSPRFRAGPGRTVPQNVPRPIGSRNICRNRLHERVQRLLLLLQPNSREDDNPIPGPSGNGEGASVPIDHCASSSVSWIRHALLRSRTRRDYLRAHSISIDWSSISHPTGRPYNPMLKETEKETLTESKGRACGLLVGRHLACSSHWSLDHFSPLF